MLTRFEFVQKLINKFVDENDIKQKLLDQLSSQKPPAELSFLHYLFNELSELALIIDESGNILARNSKITKGFPSFHSDHLHQMGVDVKETFSFFKENTDQSPHTYCVDISIGVEQFYNVDIAFSKLSTIKPTYLLLVSNLVDTDSIYNAVVDAQEKERARLAIDIHDSIGQQLTAIKLYLNTAVARLTDEQMRPVQKATDAMDSTIEEMRNICFNLLPKTLEENSLYEALQIYFKKTRNGYKIDFDWNLGEVPVLKKEFEVAVFRMFQEFLSNSIRHGKASKLHLDIHQDQDELKMRFEDNGTGFNLNEVSEFGMGIKNIITRTKLFKGFVNIASTPGKGTTYDFTFRLNTVLE